MALICLSIMSTMPGGIVTQLVVEEYAVVAVAFVGSCELAHTVQRPGYVSQIPAALDTAMLAIQGSYIRRISVLFLILRQKSVCRRYGG